MNIWARFVTAGHQKTKIRHDPYYHARRKMIIRLIIIILIIASAIYGGRLYVSAAVMRERERVTDEYVALGEEFYYMARYSGCLSFTYEMMNLPHGDREAIETCLSEAAYRYASDHYNRQRPYGWSWAYVQALSTTPLIIRAAERARP